jgi:serine/threonine-protein kinase
MTIAVSQVGKVATAGGLLEAVRRVGLLGPLEFERVHAKLRDGRYPRDPDRLAARLVRRGMLTEYQARCALHGMANRLAIGRYVVLDPLGRGSMGRVYRARHRLLDRIVALKVIDSSRVQQGEAVARFLREMRLVGRLDHPNVVRALDADRIGNIPFIVLEYVPGRDLGRILASSGPLSPAEVVNLGVQAASGLAHAHLHGVIHRDVKPSNLLLGDDGRLRVLDLGLGTLMEPGSDDQGEFATAAGVVVGTVEYVSPEQAAGLPVDGRGDLYSLGCTLYHLLAGEVPFPGGSKVERLARRIQGRPVPLANLRPDLPARLLEVMDRAMANRPGDRYLDGLEFAAALRPFAAMEGWTSSVTTTPASDPSHVDHPMASSPTVGPICSTTPKLSSPYHLALARPTGGPLKQVLRAAVGFVFRTFGRGT